MTAPSALAVLRAVDPTALGLYLAAVRGGRVTPLRTYLRRLRQGARPETRAALRMVEVAMMAALGDRR